MLAGFVMMRLRLRAPVEERIRFSDALEAAQTVSQSFKPELRCN